MPVAFGLGFQNNFHLLNVNWWQPWELGVKASIYQPSFALWCRAFWNVHFRFLALHSGLRMGLVFLVIAVASERDLRSWNEPLILRIHCFQEHSFNLVLVFIPQILQLQKWETVNRWVTVQDHSSGKEMVSKTGYWDPWLWVFRFKAQTDPWSYTSNISILKGFSWFLASLHPYLDLWVWHSHLRPPSSITISWLADLSAILYLSLFVPVGLLGRIF